MNFCKAAKSENQTKIWPLYVCDVFCVTVFTCSVFQDEARIFIFAPTRLKFRFRCPPAIKVENSFAYVPPAVADDTSSFSFKVLFTI